MIRSGSPRTPNIQPAGARVRMEHDAPIGQPSPGPLPTPDPGSGRAERITLLVLIPVFILVVVLQQVSVSSTTQNAIEQAQGVTAPDQSETFELASRIFVKFEHLLRSLDQGEGSSPDAAIFAQQAEMMTSLPVDEIRVAILEGELLGPDAARKKLAEAMEKLLDEGHPYDEKTTALLMDDIDALDRLYAGEPVGEDERQGLVDRHGWFGELALSFGLDDDDPARKPLISGGGALVVGLGIFGMVLVVVLIAGLVLLIVGLVRIGSGAFRFRFRRPSPGGSVYLETFTVFVVSFACVQLLSALLEGHMSDEAHLVATLGAQWLVALSIFWPLVRGVPVARWRQDMGYIAPDGVLREIGAGLLVYLAGIPLYFMAAFTSLALVMLRQLIEGAFQTGGEGSPPMSPPQSNPIIEMIQQLGFFQLLLLGSLVVFWAPIVEEGIMRGALYRHLRSRLGFTLSAIASALVFAMLHQYDVLMLVPIITLGAVFAFIREWRGSLIGCMTGHCLHNATVFALVIWLLNAT
ncbi:MAG TPA: CPBP family intramembrane metalloprotease [Phycisphaerales bacterium]|nr:CPBP family intramembrane metalloprotease [Phycisphaerales bacterium]